MAPNRGQGSRGGAKDHSNQARTLKRKRDLEDVESLTQQVADFDPKPTTPLVDFSQLPLSRATQDGLKSSHFKKLTNIQAQAVPVALKGGDVLGAAKTGSGKTLAFLIPVLENLYRKRWTEYDGLGALILSPTRELAIQIFDVLRKVGRNHSFSAGLVIGGKSLQEERDRLGRMNILVATPGRILQHMDQTADLDIGNLQMLVLDEADRIMDMGFQHSVDAIVGHLPKDRQTLLFSATQTKKVSDLARLSLNEPEFVSVHESAESATPSSLQQNYVITPLPEKLDTLWSFIRANVKKKILVFFSSGKQVRFAYEAFRHLQPGLSLLHLHGRQKQTARLEITTKFSNSKYACLFSTDVAARGLDFPAVDWVVQIDCPEDADTYIHRVGRTARYENDGRAVLFLDPSEKDGMLTALEKRRVTGVEEIRVKQGKLQNSIKIQLQNMCFKDPELKYLGQKAFASYVRSVFVQKDKTIFDAKKLDLEEFAASMGLPGAPKVKFIKGEDAKSRKNMPRALAALQDRDDSEGSDEEGDKSAKQKEKPVVRTKYDRMFERRNQDVLADHYTKMIDDGDGEGRQTNPDTADADSDEDFMAVKRRFTAGDVALGALSADESESESDSGDGYSTNDKIASAVNSTPKIDPTTIALTTKKSINLSTNPDAQPLIVDSNRRSKLLKSKKALLKYKGHGSHVVFSDDENDNEGREKVHYENEIEFKKRGAAAEQKEKFLAQEKEKVKEADEIDREVAKMKRRDKKIKRKEKERLADAGEGDSGDEDGVQLVPFDEDELVHVDENNDSEREGGKKKEKRKRKWFEDPETDDDDDDNDENNGQSNGKKSKTSRYNNKMGVGGGGIIDENQQPQTLEDLEAMASGLITGR